MMVVTKDNLESSYIRTTTHMKDGNETLFTKNDLLIKQILEHTVNTN